MKKALVLLVVVLLNACATMSVVVHDNGNCQGVDDYTTAMMFDRADEVKSDQEAAILRDEASICDAMYAHFLNGIIVNRHVSKRFTEESVSFSRNSEFYTDRITVYKEGLE